MARTTRRFRPCGDRGFQSNCLQVPDALPFPLSVRMGNNYPCFRFHGYSMTPVDREWKIVTLENRWIRVLVAPEIGGKVLGPLDLPSRTVWRVEIQHARVMLSP